MTRSRGPRTATALLERAVIDAFDGDARLSRVELARRTGLSRTVVTALVAGLLDRGVLTTAPPAPRPGGGPGRRPATYRLTRAGTPVALVHAHRTHTSVTLMTPDGPLAEHAIAVPWTRPWEEWSTAVEESLAATETAADRTSAQVVLAVPFPSAPQPPSGTPTPRATPPPVPRRPRRSGPTPPGPPRPCRREPVPPA